MIVSFKLLGYCLLIGGGYLLIIDLLFYKFEKYVPTLQGFPQNLLEPKNPGGFVSGFIIQYVFFVMMPSVVYGWFYTVIPFSGIRGGLATALFLFLFGMIPFGLLILFRIRIPVLFLLYLLLGVLLKLMGSMAIIGYLYSL
jgi:hypothetical protein